MKSKEQLAAERYPATYEIDGVRYDTPYYNQLRAAFLSGFDAAGEWVSVETEQPSYGLYIVQYYNPFDPSKQPYVIPLWRGRNGWYYDNSEKEPAEDNTLKVTHWQPMPSPKQ